MPLARFFLVRPAGQMVQQLRQSPMLLVDLGKPVLKMSSQGKISIEFYLRG